jgi:type IV pilus assembly protein PilM
MVGIDISPTDVKLIALSKISDVYSVEAYARAVLPENTMVGHVVKETDKIANVIKNLVAVSHLSFRDTILAIPESSVITKIIQINHGLNDYELEKAVILAAKRYIPYRMTEINMDFSVLGASTTDATMLDVLIVVAKTDYINSRLEVMKRAGLEVKIIDVELYAIERAVHLLELQAKTLALLMLEGKYVRLFVLQDMRVIFSREEEYSSKSIVAEASPAYELSPQEDLVSFKALMLNQAKRLLHFFASTNASSIEQLILAGTMANLSLAAFLQAHFNIPTRIADPIASMNLSNTICKQTIAADSSLLMLGCGLALRALTNDRN